MYIYRHNDMEHLEELLRTCPSHYRKLVVTDSLFSMDGEGQTSQTVQLHICCMECSSLPFCVSFLFSRLCNVGDFANLEGLVRLRREFGFLLAIDDAHATLVCGSR